MAKPTHAYIEHDNEGHAFKAHYGKLQAVMEHLSDPGLGGFNAVFKHPTKGPLACFNPIGEPEVIAVNGKSAEETRRQIKSGIRREGIAIVQRESLYSGKPLIFFEVGMAEAKTVRPPGGLYTQSLGPCFGISLYNPETHYTHLFHTPGCERKDIPGILKHLEDMLAQQAAGADKVQVNIASGLMTWDDEEVEQLIRTAREQLVLSFFARNLEPKTHFVEKKGYAVGFMAINSHNGLVEIIEKDVRYL